MQYAPSLSVTSVTNSLRFRHPCHICGGTAPFGQGANLRKVLADKATGKSIRVEDLGVWTCGPSECSKIPQEADII